MTNIRPWLITLLLAALAVRLAWCFARPVDEAAMFRSLPDQQEYLSVGRSLAAGQGFEFYDSRFNQTVFAFRAPGYPLLVAACGGNVRAVQVVQCAMDTSIALAVYLLARRWLSASGSLLSAAVVCFNPFFIFFCSLVLSETFFIFLFIWGLALVTKTSGNQHFTSRKKSFWWAGVVLLAISVIVRPSAIFLPAIIATASLWMQGRRWTEVFAAGGIAGLLTVMILLPWAIRNHSKLNSWIWTTTNGGFTLYDGLNPAADGSSNQSFVETMPELSAMTEVQRSEHLASAAIHWAKNHPAEVVSLGFRKLARTWSPVPLSTEYGRKIYIIAAAAYAVPVFLLAIVGIFTSRLPFRTKVFLLLPAIYFSATQVISVGSLRYRLPAEPPLAVLAVVPLVGLLGRRVEDRELQ